MDSSRLPVVKLTEQSLRRIKEKLEKLRVDDKAEDNASTKKSATRAPKFEVYKPGVSRLSNRNISFDSTPQSAAKNTARDFADTKSSTTSSAKKNQRKHNDNSKTELKGDGKQQRYKSKNDEGRTKNRDLPSRGKNTRSWKKSDVMSKKVGPPPERSRLSSSSSSCGSYDDDEEGFLARHERRRRRRGYHTDSAASEHEDTKQRMASDDEFIWDDYHGDFLKSWPNENFEVSTVSDEVAIPTNNPDIQEKSKKLAPEKELPIAATNLPRSDDDYAVDSEPLAHGDRAESTRKNPERGLIKRAPDQLVDEQKTDTRKQLFNPDNPDIPIMVRSNVRDKKWKAKTTPEPSQGVVSETTRSSKSSCQAPAQYGGHEQAPAPNRNPPPAIPAKYASHPHQWTPVSIEYPEFEHDKNVDHDDLLPSGVEGRSAELSHENLLKEAESLESTINSLLASENFSMKIFNEKLQISRTQLKQIYKSLILHHIDVSTKHNIEQLLWKTVYHQLLEQLRKRIASATGDEKNDLKNLLVVVLDQATEFYENLLMRLQQMYKINLKDLFANVASMKQFQKRIGKRTKLAMMTCQRSLICLGDISRYKENANETSNFGRARQYYIQARMIEPRNGRPYNQLALLAVHTRRKLDAIYYYTRSLATLGNPILTARESLIALFDDARRKYQKWEGGRSKEKEAKTVEATIEEHASSKRRSSIQSPRMIWLIPGEEETAESSNDVISDRTAEEQQSESSSLASMSPSQLLRHFLLVFTHVHGKLFTRVGLDTFEKLKQHLLDLFHKVLCEETPLISKQTLQYIFAINFFTVYDQGQRIKSESAGTTSTWLSVQAVDLAFSMIALLTRHVTVHLTELPIQAGQFYDPSLYSQLSTLLPSLKIAYDWMYSSKTIWYPKPPPRPTNTQHDIWSSLAELSDWLIGDYKAFPMRIFNQNHLNREEVCLSEDFELSGFAPLSNVDYEARYVLITDYTSSEQRHRTCDCVRLDLIRDFLEYLCGMEDPLLAFKQGRYVVLVESSVHDEVKPRLSSTDEANINSLEETSIVNDVITEEEAGNDDADLSELKALRNSLQQTKYDHDKRKDQIIASLEASIDKRTIYVKPQNLIPDTNCFIDHLSQIIALTKTGIYTVYVPLVVLTELQGLSQDGKGVDDHAVKVRNNASAAVDFLRRKFSNERDVKLQALTNQGSILHTISFQSQSDASSKATNDDLILQCCVKFEEKLPQQPKQSIRTVLLSDDRNLRVKALASNMPTKTLSDFCKWANVTKS